MVVLHTLIGETMNIFSVSQGFIYYETVEPLH